MQENKEILQYIDKKKIDKLAKGCKAYLTKVRKESKATLKDLRVIALAELTKNFELCKATKLYNLHSGEYCESLRFFYDTLKEV